MNKKPQGFWSNEDITRGIDDINRRFGYSKRLEFLQRLDIEMLVNLSDIDPEVLEFEDCDMYKGGKYQMVATPTEISIGLGSTSYYSFREPESFKEGIHFRFV